MNQAIARIIALGKSPFYLSTEESDRPLLATSMMRDCLTIAALVRHLVPSDEPLVLQAFVTPGDFGQFLVCFAALLVALLVARL